MKRKLLIMLTLLFLSFLPIVSLFHQGLPITHDGKDHVARIANFYQNLVEGVVIPRWAGNLNWGYGHPILMFLYPFSSYTVSFFHFLGFSLIESIKIFLGLTFILSGVAMYLWTRTFLGTIPSLAAAFLYLYAPYRFIDLYVRGAIGEHAAFIFPPLILYFLHKLAKEPKEIYFLGGVISVSGLILAHNAISIMFLPIISLYMVYLLSGMLKKKRFIFHACLFMLLGFSLASFFWVPAFFEGKFTLRDKVIAGTHTQGFVAIERFLFGEWDYGGTGRFTVQIGVVHWLAMLISIPVIFIFKKNKKREWLLLSGSVIIFWLTLFLMTEYSDIVWRVVKLLQNFQFPWRFLAITVFLTAVVGGLTLQALPKKLQIALCIVGIITILLLQNGFWQAKGYLQEDETFYTGIYDGTTDTGESAPIWSVRFMEKRPKAHMEVVSGNATIMVGERRFTKHEYVVDAKEQTRLKENTLYFPGWRVYIDGSQVTDLQFQDPMHRGLMTFFVEKGKHTIATVFYETKLRLFANAVSAISLIFVVLIIMQWKKRLI